MTDTTGLIMGLGLAVAIALILAWRAKRKQGEAWQGTVTEIRRKQGIVEEGERDQVVIGYRTDAGKKGRLHLDVWAFERTYPSLAVNDRLIKESGAALPRKA